MSKDKEHAEKCAQKIRNYWAARGHKVKVSVKRDEGPRFLFFPIESNLIDGLPKELKK